MDPQVQYLLSLGAVRDHAKLVGSVADSGKLTHFNFHKEKLDAAVEFVASIIKRDFGPDRFHTIPPHGRWQHFEVGGIQRIAGILENWKNVGCDDAELTRALVDLFFVSVLLDAGAGDDWRYKEPGTGQTYERSEGIAVASLHMFNSLVFTASEDGIIPVVDGKGLQQLDTRVLSQGFQVTDDNPMLGVDSRAALLRELGKSLLAHPNIFGPHGRPGRLVDYLRASDGDTTALNVHVLWGVLQTLLIPIWPKDRTTLNGIPIGDAWPLSTLQTAIGLKAPDDIVRGIQPFHKLTQWLTYSLMVPFQRLLDLQWENVDSLTALAEYRNGGLFVDLEVLTLKKEALDRGLEASGGPLPLFEADDDVIVEWRALTLVLIDVLHQKIQSRMDDGVHLTMAQLLEAGTWKSGREIAAQLRPHTKSSPILIKSDGTVF